MIPELKVINGKNNLPEDKIQDKLREECKIALKQIEKKEYVSVLMQELRML